MCSMEYNTTQKLDAYKGLCFVYFNIKTNLSKDDKEFCITTMKSLDLELNMRINIQVRMDIETLVKMKVESNLLKT